MVAALKDPEVAQRIRDLGMEPVPTTPEELAAFIDSEIDKISKVLAQAGDVPDAWAGPHLRPLNAKARALPIYCCNLMGCLGVHAPG